MTETVKEIAERLCPGTRLPDGGCLLTDTTEFMNIGPGDVIKLGGMHYLVNRDAVERGFDYEDPKFWVKKCKLLETGEPKILKLVFHESFPLKIGSLEATCYRSPSKESRMLDIVRGDMRFMQGETALDAKGNPVRIIEVIQGKRIDKVVGEIDKGHEAYFHECFPGIFEHFLEACEAIAFLHKHGERHGDICRDHLMREYSTGRYRWIDFDYAYESHESPFALDVFGLGGILALVVGKWDYTPGVMRELGFSGEALNSLEPGDFSLLHGNRVMNLKKLFPYVPERLNRVLMHFSAGAEVSYETVDEMLDELRGCLA